jgi:SAM-dependent methyltransferase
MFSRDTEDAFGTTHDLTVRKGLAACAKQHTSVLEIGPFFSPSLTGPNVQFFDVIDSEALAVKARISGMPTDRIPHIDFVNADGDLSTIGQKFEAVFSAHCIEHQTDLIGHLMQVRDLLLPGGSYYLIVPDKRYCFDYFHDESNIAAALTARGSRRHSLMAIISHLLLSTHNSAQRHWAGDHADPDFLDTQIERAELAIRVFNDAKGGYVDVHGWHFTPLSFKKIIKQIEGETRMRVALVNDTPLNLFEFTAVLEAV